jgi:hypothetical protein
MRLCGIRALALSQGLSSCPARPKSATGHGARLTLPARSGHSRKCRKADIRPKYVAESLHFEIDSAVLPNVRAKLPAEEGFVSPD